MGFNRSSIQSTKVRMGRSEIFSFGKVTVVCWEIEFAFIDSLLYTDFGGITDPKNKVRSLNNLALKLQAYPLDSHWLWDAMTISIYVSGISLTLTDLLGRGVPRWDFFKKKFGWCCTKMSRRYRESQFFPFYYYGYYNRRHYRSDYGKKSLPAKLIIKKSSIKWCRLQEMKTSLSVDR